MVTSIPDAWMSSYLSFLDGWQNRTRAVTTLNWPNTDLAPPDLSGGSAPGGGGGGGPGHCDEGGGDGCFNPGNYHIDRSATDFCDPRLAGCLMPIDTAYLHSVRTALNSINKNSPYLLCRQASARLDTLWAVGAIAQGRAGLPDYVPQFGGGGPHDGQTYRMLVPVPPFGPSVMVDLFVIHIDEDVLKAVKEGRSINGRFLTEHDIARILLHEAFHTMGFSHAPNESVNYTTLPFHLANVGVNTCFS